MMWPLLLTSLAALTVVFERLFFTLHERANRDSAAVERIFAEAERGDFTAAHLELLCLKAEQDPISLS